MLYPVTDDELETVHAIAGRSNLPRNASTNITRFFRAVGRVGGRFGKSRLGLDPRDWRLAIKAVELGSKEGAK